MIRNNGSHEQNESTPYAVIATDCATLLDVLGNPSARAILRRSTDDSVTIDELLNTCEVSRTTIYRRVNELVDLGLLEESIRFTKGNQQRRQFRTTSDEITLRIGDNGFEARIGSNGAETPSGGLLLDESSLEQFRIALTGKDLRFRIETDGESDSDASAPVE